MKTSAALKPGLIGATAGAFATAAIGFGLSGWHTAGSAQSLARQQSLVAVTAALVPVCIAQSKLDPDAAAKVARMTTMITAYERRDYVMKAGWATISGADDPDRDVAAACAEALIKPKQG